MPDDTPNPHGPPDAPAHPEVRSDKTPVSTGGLILFGVWFVGALVLIHVVLWAVFLRLERREEARQPDVPPVARQRPSFPRDIGKIPAPRLQVQEVRDMKDLRDQENALLQKYEWVDRPKGTVRVPIDAALDMLSDPQTAAAKGIIAAEKKDKK